MADNDQWQETDDQSINVVTTSMNIIWLTTNIFNGSMISSNWHPAIRNSEVFPTKNSPVLAGALPILGHFLRTSCLEVGSPFVVWPWRRSYDPLERDLSDARRRKCGSKRSRLPLGTGIRWRMDMIYHDFMIFIADRYWNILKYTEIIMKSHFSFRPSASQLIPYPDLKLLWHIFSAEVPGKVPRCWLLCRTLWNGSLVGLWWLGQLQNWSSDPKSLVRWRWFLIFPLYRPSFRFFFFQVF